MSNQEIEPTTKILIGVLAASIVGVGVYVYFSSGGSSGNVSKGDTSVESAKTLESLKSDVKLNENSDIKTDIEKAVIDVLKKHPDEVVTAVEEGMQMRQIKAAEDLVKTTTALKGELIKTAVTFGNKNANLHEYQVTFV